MDRIIFTACVERNLFKALEQKLLARFPAPASDTKRIGELEETFGEVVVKAADMVGIAIGVLTPNDLAELVERLIGIVVGAIDTAMGMIGVFGSPWEAQAKRWAVATIFARIATVRASLADGGRA